MDARCRVDMLGGLRVLRGDREITRFSTQKAGALLAYLAYHLNRAHPREVIAEILWPDAGSPKSGRDSLNTALSSLRRQLEPPGVPRGSVILSERIAVRLASGVVTTDVLDFESALKSAAKADSSTDRVQNLCRAVALYRGELLPGYYEDWVLAEQRKLADEYFQAALELTGLLEKSGDVESAIEVAREAITRDVLREEAHGELMRLYAASGEPGAALRQYAELRALLAEELGRSPWPATDKLARQIRAQSADLAAPQIAQVPQARRGPLPTGTVTFLLTDIEGSTGLYERLGQAFDDVLERHHSLLRTQFRRHEAEEIHEAGDSFIVPFPSAADAAACAVACQKALAEHDWPEELGRLRVRMALYTGDVKAQEGDYRDVVLHRASRVLSAAHGGQILCSETTAALLRRDPDSGVQLADLGIYRLRDVPEPEKLFQVTYLEMAQSDFPPVRAERGYADNLPLQLTRFFGRAEELAELRELLTGDALRLLTLTGPGGSGKTRLALEVARNLVEAYNGAVWFVPLADLRDADLVPGAIADALGLPRSPQVEPLDQVAMVLSGQAPLLILDNLEQFGGDAGPVVHTLLDRVRSATCLATSRQRLDLPGEREYLVPPLPSPEGAESLEALTEYDSVRLFVDRAQAARPDFQITETNAEAIATLCDRLDGIPLAIELAAARAQVLTPNQMVAQLDHRFDFLVSRRRVTEERHKTLEAAIDWSYQLLDPDLQRFFCSLSVFRGGWTLEAAEAVCEEPRALDYLEQLRECSMVLSEGTDRGIRFRMLETLREYGRRHVEAGEWESLWERHAEYFVELSVDLSVTPDEASPTLSNLRAALSRAVGDPQRGVMALRLAAEAAWWWFNYGCTEAEVALLLEAIDGTQGMSGPERCAALASAAGLLYRRGHRSRAALLGSEALELAQAQKDTTGEAKAAFILAEAHFVDGKMDASERYYRQAYAAARAAPHLSMAALALQGLAWIAERRGEPQSAVELLQEGAAICRDKGLCVEGAMTLHWLAVTLRDQLDDPARAEAIEQEAWTMASASGSRVLRAHLLLRTGELALREGDHARAEAAFQEALDIAREHRESFTTSCALRHLAGVSLARGDHTEARGRAKRAIVSAREAGRLDAAWSALEPLTRATEAIGAWAKAARLVGVKDTLLHALRGTMRGEVQSSHDELVEDLREALGDEAVEAAYAEGRAMTLEQAIAYALSDEDEPVSPSPESPG